MRDPQLSKLTKLPKERLLALADRAQRALAVLREREVSALVESVRAQAAALGVEVSDVASRLSVAPPRRGRPPGRAVLVDRGAPIAEGRRKKRSNPMKGQKVKPWFRDPKTKATWSGRGRLARWLQEYADAGRKLTDFLVDSSKQADAERIQAKLSGSRTGGKKTGSKKAASKKKQKSE